MYRPCHFPEVDFALPVKLFIAPCKFEFSPCKLEYFPTNGSQIEKTLVNTSGLSKFLKSHKMTLHIYTLLSHIPSLRHRRDHCLDE